MLVGPALQHLSFARSDRCILPTSLLILVLGASGWVKRLMQSLPMPIVMGMVAGVFLRFGLDLVRALRTRRGHRCADGHRLPVTVGQPGARPAHAAPVIGALLVGALAIAVLGRIDTGALGSFAFAAPLFQAPVWSLGALIELVVPLASPCWSCRTARASLYC